MSSSSTTASFGERMMDEAQRMWHSLRFWQVMGIVLIVILIVLIVAFLLWWFLDYSKKMNTNGGGSLGAAASSIPCISNVTMIPGAQLTSNEQVIDLLIATSAPITNQVIHWNAVVPFNNGGFGGNAALGGNLVKVNDGLYRLPTQGIKTIGSAPQTYYFTATIDGCQQQFKKTIVY